MRENLKDEVARMMRDDILSGKLHPGSRIDLDAVAGALEISRLPVREALIVLETEGLVESSPRRGFVVSAITPDDIRDHFRMYGALSGIAAERAAMLMTEDDLAALEASMIAMVDEADPHVLDRLNADFHARINRVGGTRRLKAVLRLLANSMPTHSFEFHGREWPGQVVDEHQVVLSALRLRDGLGAAAAMIQHFETISDQAVVALTNSGFWDPVDPDASTPVPGDSAQHAGQGVR